LRGTTTGTKKRGLITAGFWILLGILISIWSSTFPFGSLENQGPAIFPLGSGLALILLGSILLLQEVKQADQKVVQASPLMPSGRAGMRVGLSLAGMLLAAIFFDLLGFMLTVFCLMLFLMRVSQPSTWKVDLFYSMVFTVGSYLLFRVILKTTLPKGLIGF
jgi:putative tricarboxylic transport membrane protein